MTTATADRAAVNWSEPGVYDDVPAAEYFSAGPVSQSLLKRMDQQSPAHARYVQGHPEPATPAKIEGEATHLAVLQPELFGERFVVSPPCAETTKAGKPCSRSGSVYRDGAWFCSQHDPWKGAPSEWSGPVVLAADVYERVMRTRDAVRAHPFVSELLDRPGVGVEQAIVWRDPESGVLCKSRLDLAVPGIGVADLKTCLNASEDSFRKDMANLGYALQAAFYLRAAEAVGLDMPHFLVIAAEKPEPNGVAVYRIHEGSIYAEGERLDRLLQQWAECEASGEWPGYPLTVQDISLPDWRFKQLDAAAF